MKLLDIAIFITEGLFKLLFGFLEFLISLLSGDGRKKEFNAQFETAGSSDLLSSFNHGFCLNGEKSLSAKLSFQNALVVASTGGGKSSVVLIPTLFKIHGSCIVNDPSGELFLKTAAYLKSKNYDVKVLNFANASVSAGYNPILRAVTSSDINKVASMLVSNALGNSGNNKDFWAIQATSVIGMTIRLLKKQDQKYQNLFNVCQLITLINSEPKAMDKLFGKSADVLLWSDYKSFITYDDKVISGVLATCKAALSIFSSDENVSKVTSFDTLSFDDFRKRPTVLFLNNSVADARYYSIVSSIFFEQLFGYVMSKFPKKDEQPIYFLLDEASSLMLPTLPITVANIRKFSSGALILIQEMQQLFSLYSNAAHGIISNCYSKMYLGAASPDTARDLEGILGKFQFEDDQKNIKIKNLMEASDIRMLSENKGIIIAGNHPPILADLHPYYKDWKFSRYSEMPVPDITSDIPFEDIPVLPLPNISEKTDE